MSHDGQHCRFQWFAIFDDVGCGNRLPARGVVVFRRDGIAEGENQDLDWADALWLCERVQNRSLFQEIGAEQ